MKLTGTVKTDVEVAPKTILAAAVDVILDELRLRYKHIKDDGNLYYADDYGESVMRKATPADIEAFNTIKFLYNAYTGRITHETFTNISA